VSSALNDAEDMLVATVRAFIDRDVKPTVREVVAVRIHGGNGYSTEYDVERYFRDAPPMIVGEGTNEIQRNMIARRLVVRGGI
jgi:hypothetical protein